jgi:hypothetical protein
MAQTSAAKKAASSRTTKKAAASKTAASKTDPATGAPARASSPAATDPSGPYTDGPTTVEGTTTPDAPADAPKVAATGAGHLGTPIAPDGTVNTALGYEPVGETGASNDHDLLAGGMPEASEALSAELKSIDEVTIRRRAFTDNGNETVTATKTVLVDFVPAQAKRTSTVQVFIKGQTYPTADVARKLSVYDRAGATVRYDS